MSKCKYSWQHAGADFPGKLLQEKREQSFKEDLNSIRLTIQSIRKLSCMEICLELLDAIFVSELNSCTVC